MSVVLVVLGHSERDCAIFRASYANVSETFLPDIVQGHSPTMVYVDLAGWGDSRSLPQR